MIRLAPTSKLQALLSGAVSATQPDVVVCFRDISPKIQASFTPQFKVTATSGASAVDICDAPDPATTREVDFISLRNNDSASVTTTIRVVASSTNYNLIRVTLLTLETLTFTAAGGWHVTDVNGNVKTAIAEAVTGVWIPALAGSSAAGTQTYALQAGTYTKNGQQICATWNIGLSAKDAATAGDLRITGLPFGAGATYTWPATLGYTRNFDLNVAGGFYVVQGLLAAGNSYVELYEAGDNVVPAALTAADFGATTFIYGQVTYQSA